MGPHIVRYGRVNRALVLSSFSTLHLHYCRKNANRLADDSVAEIIIDFYWNSFDFDYRREGAIHHRYRPSLDISLIAQTAMRNVLNMVHESKMKRTSKKYSLANQTVTKL